MPAARWVVGAVVVALASYALAADQTTAELSFRGGSWEMDGWGTGTPVLHVAGAELSGSGHVEQRVAASKVLVEATVTAGHDTMTVWLDLRAGHHYTLEPDPCCSLTYGDADGELMSRARCGTRDHCPDGTVEVDKLVYRKDGCGDAPTCAPPALIRARGDKLAIAWNGDAAEAIDARYRPAPTGRESPQHLVVTRGGRIVWDVQVMLHPSAHYTLTVAATGPQLAVDD